MEPFRSSFTQQEPISEEAIAEAVKVMRTGRIHRYNTVGAEMSVVSKLEAAFAAYQGQKYCLACASGGYAMSTALRAAGVKFGDNVLTNSFTLAPVPGAIAAVGANAVFVEIDENLVIDFTDLVKKIDTSCAKVLLLSNMRGHLCDMEKLSQILSERSVALIEDCAHTMGARWNGKPSGSFGLAGCFSTQTYKHLNSGEGGLLTSDDPDFMARAIVLSGSYMLFERHGAAPSQEVFEKIRLETPNMSGRLDNLRAAILLPQLECLDENIKRWNERYRTVEKLLAGAEAIYVPKRAPEESYVGSSIQFLVPQIDSSRAKQFVMICNSLGVELKWFGDPEPVAFTSNHHSWKYTGPHCLPNTDAILSCLFDMRIPLTFSIEDCEAVSKIIVHSISQTYPRGVA